MPAADHIDVEYQEQAFEPSVTPPRGLSRADVLTSARILAAEINGVAALVEGGLGKVRPEFLNAWRRWCGAWNGYYIALERLPFDVARTDADLQRRQAALRVWREGLAFELGNQPQDQAQAAPVAVPAPATSKRWPWWATVLGLGGAGILVWKVGQWIFSSPYQSTSQVVNDAVGTVDTVNAVRKQNKQAQR